MRAGKLNRRLTIERRTVDGADDFNAPTGEWQAVATVWAGRMRREGSERVVAAELAGVRTAEFEVRSGVDVRVTDRLRFDGRIWNVTDVREIGRGVGLLLTATARAE